MTATYPRYWTKLPRQSFESCRPRKGWTTNRAKKVAQIESFYAAGYTNEPYIQLVEETADKYLVIGEWMPGKGWVSTAEAAGFVAHPVR